MRRITAFDFFLLFVKLWVGFIYFWLLAYPLRSVLIALFPLLSFLCGYIHIGVVGLVLFTLLTLLICVTNASTNSPLHPLTQYVLYHWY